jgi:hypothetical protein
MKDASITFKTTTPIKQTLERLAQEGYRSLSAQVEMMILNYLKDHNIKIEKND